MELVRVGVVGAGFGARVHVPALRLTGRAEVAVICARTPERARAAAESAGVARWAADWRDVVSDASIDAVTIATPPAAQVSIALAAIASGKAVLCEKPLAVSAADARALARAAEAAGVPNAVDFEFPEIAAWQRAKAALLADAVGTLRHVSVDWKVLSLATRRGGDSWKLRPADGGGALNNFGAHVLHYLEWFCGPVASCLASVPRVAAEPDTCAELHVRFESGALAGVSIATDACTGPVHRLEFHGARGTLVLENRTTDYARGFGLRFAPADGPPVVLQEPESGDGSDGRTAAIARLAGRFLDWQAGGAPAVPTFACGLRVQELIEAAAASLEREAWQTVTGRGLTT